MPLRLSALVTASASPAKSSAAGAPQNGQGERTYTVRAGDTLSKISKEFYGDANKYMKIFEANRGVLSDPNRINPGQTLKIPA